MKTLFSIIILLTISLTNINNAFSISPDVFIQSTVNRASQLLSKDITKDEKMNQLKLIAKETVDISAIGFYSLGSARKGLNENQKKTYLDLFEKYFLKSLTSRLKDYTEKKFEVISSDQKSETYTIVNSKIAESSSQPEIKIDWRVYTKNVTKPIIRDLIVEGLSLAKTQKEEFASILNSNKDNINILFLKLQEFIDN